MSTVYAEENGLVAPRGASSESGRGLGMHPLLQARGSRAIGDSLLLAAAAHLRYCVEFQDSPHRLLDRRRQQRDWLTRALRLGGNVAHAFYWRR